MSDQLTTADHEGMPDECDADDCRSNATHIERIEGLNWYLCDAHESRFWTGPSPEQIEADRS